MDTNSNSLLGRCVQGSFYDRFMPKNIYQSLKVCVCLCVDLFFFNLFEIFDYLSIFKNSFFYFMLPYPQNQFSSHLTHLYNFFTLKTVLLRLQQLSSQQPENEEEKMMTKKSYIHQNIVLMTQVRVCSII